MSFTIKDIAKLADVSAATVSRVLNGKTDRVSEETRKRIEKIAEENGYHPNELAKGLVTRRTHTIGIILPDITNPFFPELARGIEDGALESGFQAFLCNTDDQLEKEKLYIRALEQKCIDGIVFASGIIGQEAHISKLVNDHIPFVMLDRRLSGDDHSGIFFDNEKGGYLAARHLLDLGHREIGYITGPIRFQNDKDRVDGFKRAFAEAGIPINPNYIVRSDYRMESGEKAAAGLLSSGKITAIFANNDLMAIGVYEAAEKLKFKIPEDLSVIGFDDILMARCVKPRLTTIHQPTYEMGCEASKILAEMIQDKHSYARSVVFKPELIIRESTAPVRKSD